MALPTSALEEWRYSRIDTLDLDDWSPAATTGTAPSPAGVLSAPGVADLVAGAGPNATAIVTVDGRLTTDPGGVAARPSGAGDLGSDDSDPFTVLNRAFAPDPVVVDIPAGATAAPVVIVHWCTRDGAAVFPRVTVRAGQDCDVTVLEIVAGPGRVLAVPVTEIDVAAAARVSYLQVQLLGEQAWQIGAQLSTVERDATLVSAAVALGGDYARMRTTSDLVGPGGSTRLLALYFGAGSQMHDFRTVQGHRSPKTTSDLLYKGVVANRARSVYSGLIRVEKGARGANAFQTNRNLVLHEGAHADSVPNLEIEDNDVRCSHASAVGPIAEDQRFYLESRGVPPTMTERLLSLGFLGEIVGQLPLAGLTQPLLGALAGKLDAAERAESDGHGVGA